MNEFPHPSRPVRQVYRCTSGHEETVYVSEMEAERFQALSRRFPRKCSRRVYDRVLALCYSDMTLIEENGREVKARATADHGGHPLPRRESVEESR